MYRFWSFEAIDLRDRGHFDSFIELGLPDEKNLLRIFSLFSIDETSFPDGTWVELVVITSAGGKSFSSDDRSLRSMLFWSVIFNRTIIWTKFYVSGLERSGDSCTTERSQRWHLKFWIRSRSSTFSSGPSNYIDFGDSWLWPFNFRNLWIPFTY